MKRTLAAAVAALLVSTAAWSQSEGQGPRYGYGGGYGPGMMGGYGGYGPGMMSGRGPRGNGNGNGNGGEDGGYGCAAGPGMMGACAGYAADLTPEQREKMRGIQRDLREKQWRLREQMQENAIDAQKRIDALLTREQRDKLGR